MKAEVIIFGATIALEALWCGTVTAPSASYAVPPPLDQRGHDRPKRPPAPNSGWRLFQAAAINNYGVIVGYGSLNGSTAVHAYLMKPG